MEHLSPPRILKGTVVRDHIRDELKVHVLSLGQAPRLVIIQVGDRADSSVYIKQKIDFGLSVGVDVVHRAFPEDITEDTLKENIQQYNDDTTVTGIIVQLPLPSHISPEIINTINPQKDVDCLSQYHKDRLTAGYTESAPATARAIMKLLEYYKISVSGRQVVVVGRSALVGAPTAELLRCEGSQVSVIHRQTDSPKNISRKADVLVVACGVPELVDISWIDPQKDTVVIDVGIHRVEKGGVVKLVGDVRADSVGPGVGALSPVPGGVGPVTVACLFERVVNGFDLE